MCAGGGSWVKPLASIVAHYWFALVRLTGQAGFCAGGRIAKARVVGIRVGVGLG